MSTAVSMASSKQIEVCVVGGGVCGIASVKACLEANFKVTCYEKTSRYGGLWNYHTSSNSDGTFVPSVMDTTVLNTSKELSSFSDFPPPSLAPNFMKHQLYMDYIRDYVATFKIEPHMELEHEVLQCKPEFNLESGDIKWLLEIKNLKENRVFQHKCDRLMIAIGHHNIPLMPTFNNQHLFKGEIIHSVRVKTVLNDKKFAGKRVLVVGFGNSACDVANDLAVVASKCYVATHRGSWIMGRLDPTIGPFDFRVQRKLNYHIQKFLPTCIADKAIVKRVEKRTNHQILGLKPNHQPSERRALFNDLFPYRIFTGGVVLKNALAEFTEDGVVFKGEEDEVHKVDIVILATGYMAKVPFMNEFELGLKSSQTDEYELFMNMFAPKLIVPGLAHTTRKEIKSLAFIGLIQPSGSITVVSELQARYATLVFADKVELPKQQEMLKKVQKTRRIRSKYVGTQSTNQLLNDWVTYCDDVAQLAGFKPNLSKLLFKDFALWKQLMFGPSVSYQYRLSGPGSWKKAREAVMDVNARVYCGINEGKNHILYGRRQMISKEGKSNKK